jgi:hypothetical protein
VVSACGGDRAEPATTTVPTATTCAELADAAIEIQQRVLDAMQGRHFEDEIPPGVQAVLDEAAEFLAEIGEGIDPCGGDQALFERLMCERVADLDTHGLDPTAFVGMFPAC